MILRFLVGLALLSTLGCPSYADTLLNTYGPYSWSDGCGEMQITVRVYKDVAAFPGLYKWDYEVTNISINSDHPDSYVNGVGQISLGITGVMDIANVYTPANWDNYSYADVANVVSIVDVASSSSPDPDQMDYGNQIYALQPGQTLHFGYTTFPRQTVELQACAVSDNGWPVDWNICGLALKANGAHPEIVFQPPTEAGRRQPPSRRVPRMSAMNARKSVANSRLAPAARGVPRDSSACVQTITGPIAVPGYAAARLVQFGWAQNNRQDLWRSDTFTSNGDSQIGDNVWVDTDGTGVPTVNDPAAFKAGTQGALTNVMLRTLDQSFAGTATLKIDVLPNDFSFQNAPVAFTNGRATIAQVQMGGNFPSAIKNQLYTFTWSIKFADGEFQQFQVTQHQLYLMHGLIDNTGAQYKITTMRLDYATSVANNTPAQSDSGLDAIVAALSVQIATVPGFNARWHLGTPNNVWAALDGLPYPEDGLDCESVSAIVAAQLQQLGYATATADRAYPTGGLPLGDTDATAKEVQSVNNATYALSFADGNFFEGFLTVSSPDSTNLTAYTVAPMSNGRLVSTGCTVSPTSDENLVKFRVLTSTYVALEVPYQEWRWDTFGQLPDPVQFGEIALPRNNCPAAEMQ